MKKIILGLVIVGGLAGIGALISSQPEPQLRSRLVSGNPNAMNFARAGGVRPIEFPADHGPHPDYQTEWWYYTGNLETEAKEHLGYQLTFFRSSLVPPGERPPRNSNWGADQIYMAHFSLTDVSQKRYQAFERFSRGAASLAGAQVEPYQVWLEDWQVQEVAPNLYRLRASQGDMTIDLQLRDGKGPVLQGDRGYSQKGPDPNNASYYYSLTRLATDGTVQVGERQYTVKGLSWMDHEFSTSALAANQVGWDWFSLQLDDGSELMVFQLRQADGGIDPFSSGTFIGADNETIRLDRTDFSIEVHDTWRSPRSSANYPAAWTLIIPTIELEIDVRPHLSDQELDASFVYWEGAVRIEGQRAGRPVSGHGYVEMTGYAHSMQGRF
jgi:predicted secreted hydrolase